MLITPDNITALAPNEIFTFGSNEGWRHGRGAAKTALKWGAVYGEGPFRGQTYGICTKDKYIKTLPLLAICNHVRVFLDFAASRSDLTFLVTAIGTGLAGLSAGDIAPMFKDAPANVALPQAFWEVLAVDKVPHSR